jgi:cell division protease FtsH
LLVAGVIVTPALFFVPATSSGGGAEQLGYSQLKTDIADNQVRSVAIGSDGNISGTLTNGTAFTSSYPPGIADPQFAQLLDTHDVAVTRQPAQSSILAVLLNFLPLIVVVGLFLWMGRSARRQMAGLGGIGRAVRTRRSRRQGNDPAGRPGPRRDRATYGRRAAPVLSGLPARLARHPDGRPGRGTHRVRRGLHGRGRRFGRRDRPRHANGA